VIVLVTDFGLEGPYLGQVRAVLQQRAPGVPVLDLFSDLPPFDPRSAAYLLPAYCRAPFPAGSVYLTVVDPGVGTARMPLIVQADGAWFVGPDNGVFELLLRRATTVRAWRVLWVPSDLSASFHGRDLFAPVAAALAMGGRPGDRGPLAAEEVAPSALVRPPWPDDLAAVVYVDRFGNAMTGIRGGKLLPDAILRAGTRDVPPARTFGDVAPGAPLWYVNSNGLVEIAVNGGSAREVLGLVPGSSVSVGPGDGT